MELHAHRMLEESHAAHVSRRVPGVRALIGIFLELAKIGRQQLLVVAVNGEVHPVGDEGRRVAEEVNVLVHLLDHFQRQLADQRPIRDQEDGDFLISAADGADDLQRRAFVELMFLLQIPVEQDGAVRRIRLNHRKSVFRRRGPDDLVAFFGDRVAQAIHGPV